MECFIALGLVFAFIVGFFIVQAAYKASKLNLKVEEKAWQQLAHAEKLNITPSSDRGDTVVSGVYHDHFATLRTVKEITEIYTLLYLTREKPAPVEIDEKALDKLTEITPSHDLKGSIRLEADGNQVTYEQRGVELNVAYLRNLFKLLHTLLTLYPQIISLEEEAIPRLQKMRQDSEAFQQLCTQMILDICRQANRRGAESQYPFVCPRCWTQFNMLNVILPDKGRTNYYGCRLCGQSRNFLPLKQGIVAVLNNQETTELLQEDDELKVNWLVHRELFDFDRVEIQQATDEEVERFAVQAGNDMDEMRRPCYQEMACTISSACKLSESTVRVLEHIFGEVTNPKNPGPGPDTPHLHSVNV